MPPPKRPSTERRGPERILLVDVSNSFTKLAVAHGGKIGRVVKIPTADLRNLPLPLDSICRAVVSCVVPKAVPTLRKRLPCPILWVDHLTRSGISISYPEPASIGADRLANAAAAVHHGKLPAIVVDFGTAVTFDVIDASGSYLGGIIAPGLATAAEALHERTALLPLTHLRKVTSSIGRNTRQAIRIGLLLGAVGLVREAVDRITEEAFGGLRPTVIATGGDAGIVACLAHGKAGRKLIDLTDPLLTLRGLLVIAGKNS